MGTKLRIVFLYKAQAVCDRVFYDGKEKEKKKGWASGKFSPRDRT